MFSLLLALIALAQADKFGVDIRKPVPVDTLQCLKGQGFVDYYIFRGWKSSGSFDTNAPNNYASGVAVGYPLEST